MASVGIVFGPYCMRDKRGFDFANFLDDPRGQTGSEYGVVRVAQEMAKMGHDVTLYTFGDMMPEWEGIKLRDYAERGNREHDWAICWNEAGSLRAMNAGKKACSLQINTVVGPVHGCEEPHGAADFWFCPSESHRKRLIDSSPGKWVVAYDGVDPELYVPRRPKVPGRVAWTSSPDRGLHWLLAAWPKIRKAVPWATLRIFYTLEVWLNHFRGKPFEHMVDSYQEQARRVAYIDRVLPTLKANGVEAVSAVSRRRIVEEVAASECVAYSCDPVIWSEGFSCSLMEACAAWSGPVTTNADAFPEVYGGVVPMVERPLNDTLDEFAELVVRMLTDARWREEVNERARAHAEKFTWRRMAETKARWLSGEAKEDEAGNPP